jgi:hypothetical protein
MLTVAGTTFKVYQLAGETPCPNAPVRIGEASYDVLQNAYEAAQTGDTIRCQYADLDEDIEFDRAIAVTLVGGYDCDYSYNPDHTAIRGEVVLSGGTVTVEKLTVVGS